MPDLVETPDSEHAIQAAQILNRSTDRGHIKNKSDPTTPEVLHICIFIINTDKSYITINPTFFSYIISVLQYIKMLFEALIFGPGCLFYDTLLLIFIQGGF